MAHQRKIAVIGLGYVGLPVAIAFARSGAVVIGFDVDRKRIQELQASFDRTREVEMQLAAAYRGLGKGVDALRLESAWGRPTVRPSMTR